MATAKATTNNNSTIYHGVVCGGKVIVLCDCCGVTAELEFQSIQNSNFKIPLILDSFCR